MRLELRYALGKVENKVGEDEKIIYDYRISYWHRIYFLTIANRRTDDSHFRN